MFLATKNSNGKGKISESFLTVLKDLVAVRSIVALPSLGLSTVQVGALFILGLRLVLRSADLYAFDININVLVFILYLRFSYHLV